MRTMTGHFSLCGEGLCIGYDSGDAASKEYAGSRFDFAGGVLTKVVFDVADDAYVDVIRSSPRNKAQVEFYASCTPGYYNGEGKATRSEELFVGGRYADGPMPFYELLAAWRADGNLEGLRLS